MNAIKSAIVAWRRYEYDKVLTLLANDDGSLKLKSGNVKLLCRAARLAFDAAAMHLHRVELAEKIFELNESLAFAEPHRKETCRLKLTLCRHSSSVSSASSSSSLSLPSSSSSSANDSHLLNANSNARFDRSILSIAVLCDAARLGEALRLVESLGADELAVRLDDALVGDALLKNGYGVLLMREGKRHEAMYVFARALEQLERGGVASAASHRVAVLLFNAGVALLSTIGDARDAGADVCATANSAYECLGAAVRAGLTARPRLWLRMAECGVQAHVALNLTSTERTAASATIVRRSKRSRLAHVALDASSTAAYRRRSRKTASTTELQRALMCARNALYLLGDRNDDESACALSTRVASLATLAYVYLELKEPLAALSHCRQLLALSDAAEQQSTLRAYVRLAHTYAAEALCSLGRATQAIEEHLAPLFRLAAATAGGGGESQHDALVNMAVACIRRRDLRSATDALNRLQSVIGGESSLSMLVRVYIDIAQRDYASALRHLRLSR
jgi:tetratricopeptide (TPR) repeat protein